MPSVFDPVTIGALELSNRIVLAPMTRTRVLQDRAPGQINIDYYVQRAGAGLILTEATSISPEAVGYPFTPGLWTEVQVQGWASVVAAVHRAGSKIVSQLWHVGRISDPAYLDGALPVAPSAIAASGHVNLLRPIKSYEVPRALETHEIPRIVEDFRKAAENAKRAGFDGIELHAANGYLIDQFLHDGSNKRTDRYGGSVANRARFLMEIVDAVLQVWPAGRIGVHLNLMSTTHSMHDSDPASLFGYVAEQLNQRKLAFIVGREALVGEMPRLAPLVRQKFKGAFIANEGLCYEDAERLVETGQADAVAFARLFIANPDLVERFRRKAPLNPLNKDTIHRHDEIGYTDYPTLESTPIPMAYADDKT